MQQDLTTGKVFPVLIRFSIPIILGNLFQLVYNFTDSLMVGRILGAKELAGVGATGSINFLILGAAMGVTSGLTIFVARFYGAKNEEKMKRTIAHAFVIAAIVALLFSGVSLLLLRNILTWMHTPSDIFEFSYQYISVIFVGIIITLYYNLLAGILRSVGDSRTPLYFLIFSSLLNIALDYLFIAGLKVGVRGAAIATVIAQAVSVVLSFVFILRRYRFLLPQKHHFVPDWLLAKEMVLLGLSMGCESKRERIQAEGKRFEGVIVGYRREHKGRGVDYHYIIEYHDGEAVRRCETGGMRTKWDQRLPSAEVEVYISGSEVVVCTQDQVPYGEGVRLMRLN